ncbi:LOW QUALITY PROTEIN: TANK-binding kinase 1-binding protein 1-like [Gymnodraco acuticeps]|uniref:LOW QUALITY PROTEIN: TANK-binding kinase 1-binding protein 1-like n=1 Tax=Gymnodraco acuticeps TaxID=8218 RepID=A0A6P8UPW3_GYMAC|nr:LOW QUALITY PROTEIN: TANK-binding kinase 1-binding protein 1-like [Gymnodraco acuticeps]
MSGSSHVDPPQHHHLHGCSTETQLMMDLFRRGELGLLGGGEGLRDDVSIPGISWSANRMPEDMYPASGLALAAAYHDIKTRLASLERENSSIKRKLKHYEVKFPIISEFGEERLLCCSCDPLINDTSVIQSETTNLQQRINSLTQELQKSKEREERLEEVIQAYEKIHLEKSNVQRDLDKMAEQHVEQICGLESALRQRETSLQKLSVQLRSKDAHKSHLQLHASLDVPRGGGRGGPLQSSRSLDALSDLKLQRLEAELEGARHREEGACHREGELRAELKRLQKEVTKLQEAQRQVQEPPPHCEHCDVEWIKKAGDEQVNLALAYTELTEELGRVRSLAVKQSDLLRDVSQEPRKHPSGLLCNSLHGIIRYHKEEVILWMESEESAARSCPLCQLTFPTGYPDDALIKHIDSHLENSKI